MSDSHHIKTYIVFFIISFLLIGSLAYLYMPGSFFWLKSDVLSVSGEEIVSAEMKVSSEITISSEIPVDETAQRRLRLTNLLLHHQSELQELESGKDTTYSDEEKQNKIAELRLKIDNLQIKITALTQ